MRSNVCRAARRIHSFPRLSLSAADRRRSFEQQKVVRFPVPTVYSAVSDVDRYTEFLPWCTTSRIVERRAVGSSAEDEQLTTEICMGYKHLSATFGSTMDLQRNRRIQSTSTPNDYIEFCSFTWEFAPIGPSAARIDLKLEFELLAAEHAILWDRLQDRILAEYLNCFQRRCAALEEEAALEDASAQLAMGDVVPPAGAAILAAGP